MRIIDWILFVIIALNVFYLLIFAFASKFSKNKKYPNSDSYKSIAVLIPAYKEDRVVEECVQSCLNQDYPKEKFKVVVISDHMQDETNKRLSEMQIKLCIATYEESTKSKALNLAMREINDHDIALIFDADNTVDPDYFKKINNAFSAGKTILLQTHRVAKNVNNNLAVLDAVSEETNNSIFRQGHANLGLSAALIGSGMAFDYLTFKNKMLTIKAVGGFDRNLELSFLKDCKKIDYLSDAYVYDEKVQSHKAFSNQRKRWLSAQFHYFIEFRKDLPKAFFAGNIDFCNKYFQQLAIPRIILIGMIPIISIFMSLFFGSLAFKWWIIFGFMCIALGLAIPGNLINKRLFFALIDLPKVFFLMFMNLFKLKGANKSFIHTPHGLTKSDN